MITRIDNRKGFTENEILENIKESVNDLKKQLVEKGYDAQFINEVVNSFELDYDKIMNSDAENVFDLLENGSFNFDYKYKLEDFNEDEDIDECYIDVINTIIYYSLYPIKEMNKTINGYDIKFENDEDVSVPFRHNYTITTPLKELYDKNFDGENWNVKENTMKEGQATKLDDVVKDIFNEFDSYCINNYDRSASYLISEDGIKGIIEKLPNQDMDADWAVQENLNFYDDCLYHTFSKGYQKINGTVADDYGYVEERMTDSGNYTIDQRIAKGHAMALEQDLADVVRDVLQEYEITELEEFEKVLKGSEEIEAELEYEEEDDYDM